MASRTKSPPSIRLVESAAAELRLREARAFIRDRITGGALWLVGPSRGSVDDLARSVARECGATIGLHRFSVTQLAARLAAAVLADARLAPATYLGSEAVAARAVFDAQRAADRSSISVRWHPLRASRVHSRARSRNFVSRTSPARIWLACRSADPTFRSCCTAFEQQFTEASATDRATLFAAATTVLRTGGAGAGVPLLLLDVAFESEVEVEFLEASDRCVSGRADHRAVRRHSDPPAARRRSASERTSSIPLPRRCPAWRRPLTWSHSGGIYSLDGSRLFASRRATSASSRLLAKAASASKWHGASSKRHARGSVRRDRGVRAVATALCRSAGTRVQARGHSGLVRSRHSASASCRAGFHGRARVCVREAVGTPLCRVPVARAGAGARGAALLAIHRSEGRAPRARLGSEHGE